MTEPTKEPESAARIMNEDGTSGIATGANKPSDGNKELDDLVEQAGLVILRRTNLIATHAAYEIADQILLLFVKWGEEPCPHTPSSVEILDDNGDVIGERLFEKRECDKCWQALIKETGRGL